MKHFAHLASNLNVESCLTEILNNFDKFNPRPALTGYTDAVQELEAIAIISNDIERDTNNDFKNVRNLVDFAIRNYLPAGCRLCNLTVNKLDANRRVYPHIDTAPLNTPNYYDHRNRHHIVVKTNNKVTMSVLDETVHMQVGDLWTFNNQVMHEISNLGDEWRVHIVFDAWYEIPRYTKF